MTPPHAEGDEVTAEDALEAVETLRRFLTKMTKGKDGGEALDFADVGSATGRPLSDKEKKVLDLIRDLAKHSKDRTVSRMEVIQAADKAKVPPVQLGIVINDLKKSGHLQEPRPGRYHVASKA